MIIVRSSCLEFVVDERSAAGIARLVHSAIELCEARRTEEIVVKKRSRTVYSLSESVRTAQTVDFRMRRSRSRKNQGKGTAADGVHGLLAAISMMVVRLLGPVGCDRTDLGNSCLRRRKRQHHRSKQDGQ
ncbi:hypothetical protein VW35_15220 [Devosia soli]|uniref:Uncharacterized protein n=1 Tax=Devosia soli TaxID=361041 RepID=A0A0F5L551_9HYPH|nr:hypothetical protein VW35_15220 [Devosia soli]